MLSTGTPEPRRLSPERRSSRTGFLLIVESDLHHDIKGRTTVDRNEVLLVGRLSAAVEDRCLPSGDIMTKWRLLVRRRRRGRAGIHTDSIPCVTFDSEAAELVRNLKPRDAMEIAGAFRCRVYGPTGAKIWCYEVEVSMARAIDAERLPQAESVAEPDPPESLRPRPVAYLAEAS
jgi:single-strand DNA-binding protein